MVFGVIGQVESLPTDLAPAHIPVLVVTVSVRPCADHPRPGDDR
jgi:hypothetical protein